MVRVKNSRKKDRDKLRKAAKGFRLGRKNLNKQAKLALLKQKENAFRDRKRKKRDFRKLWIERINAAVRSRGSKYSQFIGKKNKKDIELNRKVLSNIAIVFPEVFDKIQEEVEK